MNEKQGVVIKIFKHPQNRTIWGVRMEAKSRTQPYLIRGMTAHEGLEKEDLLNFITKGLDDQLAGKR